MALAKNEQPLGTAPSGNYFEPSSHDPTVHHVNDVSDPLGKK